MYNRLNYKSIVGYMIYMVENGECEFSSIVLDSIILSKEVEEELGRFTKEYEGTKDNLLRRHDYARWSFVLGKIPDGSTILDIGVGVGQFVNAAARTNRFARICGVDINKHSHFLDSEVGGVEMHYVNATELTFEDGEFDYVTCMEVIEHLNDDDMEKAISEIRRVAGKKAIITFPYCEREPIPKYHKQRYTMPRIRKLFPEAKIGLFVRDRWINWAYVEEDFR